MEELDAELFDRMWAPVIKTLFPEETEVTMTAAQLTAISRNMFDIGIQIGQRLMVEGEKELKTPKDVVATDADTLRKASYKVDEYKSIASLNRRRRDKIADTMKNLNKTKYIGNAKR